MTSHKIGDIFHYYQYLTYVLLQESTNYPSHIYGSPKSKEEVLNAWKNTFNYMEQGKAPKKFKLYVHIPFCPNKCLFCMSLSLRAVKIKEVVGKHIKSLEKEIDFYSPVLRKFEVNSIYFGGGSPSLLGAMQISELFKKIRGSFKITKGTKIYFEASPFTLNEEKLDAIRKEGVDELSLGVQSFDKKVLKINRRPQDSKQVEKIFHYAKKIGIPLVTFDMMIGLPGQSYSSSIESIKKSIELRPDAIMLNEFMPLSHTDYCIEKNEYTKENTEQRLKTMKEVHTMLKNAGYKSTNLGYRLKWDEYDEDHVYKNQETDSVLGLGFGAFSHAYGSLKYGNLSDLNKYIGGFGVGSFFPGAILNFEKVLKGFLFFEGKDYFGLSSDLKREMHSYAYSNILNFSTLEFENRFNIKFEDAFPEQMKILNYYNLFYKDGEKIIVPKSEKSEIVKTLFIDKQYIKKMIERTDEQYDSNMDYEEKLTVLTRRVGD